MANRQEETGGEVSGNPDWRARREDVIGQCEGPQGLRFKSEWTLFSAG